MKTLKFNFNIKAQVTIRNNPFEFINDLTSNETNTKEILDILETTQYDLAPCLRKCSNNGQCKFIESQLVCECNENFTGKYCQTDIRPCSSIFCLNNGTCMSVLNETSFACECSKDFYGLRCENQINICSNRTCSLSGYCFVNATTKLSQCKCYNGFSGENCEIKDETKFLFRKSIQVISVIIAVLFIILVIVFVISMDVLNLIGIGNAKRKMKDVNNNFKEKILNKILNN